MVDVDVSDWSAELDRLHARFARSEPRRRARQYLAGLVAGLDRKNGWTLAEQAGDVSPDGMQRLLRWADWDVDPARDDVRDYVVEHLHDPQAVLIIDDTGFLKGVRSAGVARQCSGTAGRIENCQVGVFAAYRSGKGHALIDRQLYLPAAWTDDRDRCRAAGVPDDVEFATKVQIARSTLGRAFAAGIRPGWVSMDEAYGQSKSLRVWLEKHDQPYVVATRRNDDMITTSMGFARADELIAALPGRARSRISAGPGAHGPREYDRARVPIRICWQPGRGHWLLARRNRTTGELAYYVCYGPRKTRLMDLARIAGARWAIEECFQQAKGQAGLDEYQVRDWRPWHAHITLSMAALAWLVVAKTRMSEGEPAATTGR
ncbi:IS701 family transposase [Actinoplanes teichomyceticus]|uniref:SRSO17 transposase n=1 Tax=Actinoplanes teichomyceticus TaxID=1867 RepID=A0A561VLE2_ACTTI|nr:IS701 family transposase [Actinoplanes teichomyceticus]TWG12436.1 SRSO17 transposase [Actinoplanes teichomyceticus]GIF13797.1 transposase [Actinoplanes teichomyceticus]